MRKRRTLREYLIERLIDKERAIGYLRAILDDYYIFGGAAVLEMHLKLLSKHKAEFPKLPSRLIWTHNFSQRFYPTRIRL